MVLMMSFSSLCLVYVGRGRFGEAVIPVGCQAGRPQKSAARLLWLAKLDLPVDGQKSRTEICLDDISAVVMSCCTSALINLSVVKHIVSWLLCAAGTAVYTQAAYFLFSKDQTKVCLLMSKSSFALGSSITAGKNFSISIKMILSSSLSSDFL